MLHRRWIFPLLALAALLVLAACGGQSTPEPTPARQAKPTFTATPQGQLPNAVLFETPVNPTAAATEVAALPTRTPTPTELPPSPTPEPATPTATPQPGSVYANQAVNVRSGPGTSYGRIGSMAAGQRYPITGKNAAGDWWQIDFNGQQGWVIGSLVSTEGAVDGVQVASAAAPAPPRPTSPPPPPTATPVPAGPPPTAVPQFAWNYDGNAIPGPQCGSPNFKGVLQNADGSTVEGQCVAVDRYGNRQVKRSGGPEGAGAFGFSPCGYEDCKGETRVYVVECPANMGSNDVSLSPSAPPLTILSNFFSGNITDRCVTGEWHGIIFKRR